jgi:predicted HTH domain antitoxin
MTIHFEISPDIERQLDSAGTELNQLAKELLMVELYRQEQITHHQLAEGLGLNRYETDGLLKRHGIGLELSLEEFRSQVDSLRQLTRP